MFRGNRRRRQARRSRNQQQAGYPSTGTKEREAGSEHPVEHGNPWIQRSVKFFRLIIYMTLLAYTYKKKKEEKVLSGGENNPIEVIPTIVNDNGGKNKPIEVVPTIVNENAMDGVATEETNNDVKNEEKGEFDEL
eukprot:CAMPEP_0194290164 /NCGR_PEP_ID=MMETSP0169-20130528/40681_1 /TAXON_ID=218684 /ORGANISM="Corethron pennatum, Strain L29A3" /LENGTH=134 /DNA_ID=CAMNT_0039037687 /DNA_START=9 /DNA_END=413 /DNA_ORIENTATION=-